MRRFSSYGPVDKDLHYYVPRNDLIQKGLLEFMGENPDKGGRYFTVWAPRQCGKTWLMRELYFKIKEDSRFDIVVINLENFKEEKNVSSIYTFISTKIYEGLKKPILGKVETGEQFQEIFSNKVLDKPLILILDEFDALGEHIISSIVSSFRSIYNSRQYEADKVTGKKSYLLHSLALVGVRSVLGIENETGSPFNIQGSLPIPNLTIDEVRAMFKWYEKESGQHIEGAVIDRLYKEVNGQPGLISWFGELLTEGFTFYKNDRTKPITMNEFETVYAGAIYALPNNNILNLISKAKEEANKDLILKMFQTDEKMEFKFDNKTMNTLYMNGLAEPEFEKLENPPKYYIKFPSPFVQKRIFNYFSDVYFNELGTIMEPFLKLEDVITPNGLDIRGILKIYQRYLEKNNQWLFKKAPRRSDLRLFEAVFHFNLFAYLNSFFFGTGAGVYPEFPTGNGKIDLIIRYKEQLYGLELKSFRNATLFKAALEKAAHYGKQLGLSEIFLVSFIESVDDETRQAYEKPFHHTESNVTVWPFFICTGKL